VGAEWVETERILDNSMSKLLMWDMRRNLIPIPVPPKANCHRVRLFRFASIAAGGGLIVEKDRAVDLCMSILAWMSIYMRRLTCETYELKFGWALRQFRNAVDQNALRL